MSGIFVNKNNPEKQCKNTGMWKTFFQALFDFKICLINVSKKTVRFLGTCFDLRLYLLFKNIFLHNFQSIASGILSKAGDNHVDFTFSCEYRHRRSSARTGMILGQCCSNAIFRFGLHSTINQRLYTPTLEPVLSIRAHFRNFCNSMFKF